MLPSPIQMLRNEKTQQTQGLPQCYVYGSISKARMRDPKNGERVHFLP